MGEYQVHMKKNTRDTFDLKACKNDLDKWMDF